MKYWQRFTLAVLFCVSSVGALAAVLHFVAPMLNETPAEKRAIIQERINNERALEDFAMQFEANLFNNSQTNFTMTIVRRPED